MIADVWKHIRNLEKRLGMEPIAWEDVDDAQEYYQWLLDDNEPTRIDGHNDF